MKLFHSGSKPCKVHKLTESISKHLDTFWITSLWSSVKHHIYQKDIFTCESETTLSAIYKIVVYAVITWGFNEQEQQCTVTLPVQ